MAIEASCLIPSLSSFFTNPKKNQSALTDIAASILLHGAVSAVMFPPSLYYGAKVIGGTAIIALAKSLIFGSDNDARCEKHVAKATIVNLIGISKPNIYIHELGHATAALLCYQNPNVRIAATWFRGGRTTTTIGNGFTAFGKYLGEFHSKMLLDSGGLISSTTCAVTEFATAFAIRKKYPTLSNFLIYHGISQLANEILYGMRSLTASKFDLSNDFINLWQVWGIHPLIPVGLMVALPLTTVGLFTYFSREKQKNV